MCKIENAPQKSKSIVNQCVKSSTHTSLDTLGFRDVSERSFTKKLGYKKGHSLKLANSLVALDSPLKKQYERQQSCCTLLRQEGNKITTNCCRSRSCVICNGKRTRDLISGYLPYIKKHVKDMYSVTLTDSDRNCKSWNLNKTIRKRKSDFSKIIRRQRDKGNKIDAILSLEITYNKIEDWYHPHFHILVKGKSNAELIKDEWLKMNVSAGYGQQHIRHVKNKGCSLDRSLLEFFKYVTKLDQKEIPIENIDIIMRSVKGVQLIQTYGNIKKVKESDEIEIVENDMPFYDCALWKYEIEFNDWVNFIDGYMLLSRCFVCDMPPPDTPTINFN